MEGIGTLSGSSGKYNGNKSMLKVATVAAYVGIATFFLWICEAKRSENDKKVVSGGSLRGGTRGSTGCGGALVKSCKTRRRAHFFWNSSKKYGMAWSAFNLFALASMLVNKKKHKCEIVRQLTTAFGIMRKKTVVKKTATLTKMFLSL